MSGGSYDYLYLKETEDLFKLDNINYLSDMAVVLSKEGYEDVSRDVVRLIEYIKSAWNRVDVLREQLSDVMRSVEWFDSLDFDLDTLKEHIEMYRLDKKDLKEGDGNADEIPKD